MEDAPNIQIILLSNDEVLISQIDQIMPDQLGEPDCKLTSPYKIICQGENESDQLTPWLNHLTDDSVIMISSDKILTLVEPHKKLIDLYLKLAVA